jgi:hypothetical protein
MHVRAAMAIGLMLAMGRAGNAQIGGILTMSDLEAKADVVVIAELRDTKNTGRQTNHPELRPAFPVIEMQSEFEILAVLKPNARDTSFAGPGWNADSGHVLPARLGSVAAGPPARARSSTTRCREHRFFIELHGRRRPMPTVSCQGRKWPLSASVRTHFSD